MKTTLSLLAALIFIPVINGCGSSDAPAPITIENNGVKPVPDYGAMLKDEQAARDKANGVVNKESATEKK